MYKDDSFETFFVAFSYFLCKNYCSENSLKIYAAAVFENDTFNSINLTSLFFH